MFSSFSFVKMDICTFRKDIVRFTQVFRNPNIYLHGSLKLLTKQTPSKITKRLCFLVFHLLKRTFVHFVKTLYVLHKFFETQTFIFMDL